MTPPPLPALDAEARRALRDRLHDGPIQALAALSLRLQLLAAQPLDDECRELVSGMEANCRRATADLRALMVELAAGPEPPPRGRRGRSGPPVV